MFKNKKWKLIISGESNLVDRNYLNRKKYYREFNKYRQGFDRYCSREYLDKLEHNRGKIPPVGCYNPAPQYKVKTLIDYKKQRISRRSNLIFLKSFYLSILYKIILIYIFLIKIFLLWYFKKLKYSDFNLYTFIIFLS